MGSLPFLWVINDNFKSFVKTFGFIARLAILYYILDLKMFCSHKRNNLSLAQAGAEDVKRHKWFKGVDWEEVFYRKLKPPIVPKVSYDGDTRNFDDYPETDWRKVPPVTERELRMFDDF